MNKNKLLTIRVSEDELKKIKELSYGKGMSEYVKGVVFRKQIHNDWYLFIEHAKETMLNRLFMKTQSRDPYDWVMYINRMLDGNVQNKEETKHDSSFIIRKKEFMRNFVPDRDSFENNTDDDLGKKFKWFTDRATESIDKYVYEDEEMYCITKNDYNV